jgi:hypothetical protein
MHVNNPLLHAGLLGDIMFTKKILLGSAIASLIAVSALAQSWPNLPIVGGASYCSSTVNGACVNTVPAGPTAVTGNETSPADTNLSGGSAQPQTVKMSMRALNAAPVTYNLCAGAACGSVTVGNNSGGVLFDYSTTIDSATVVTPLSPMDGQRFVIAANFTITSLTVTANTGTTLSVTTPTVLTASTTVPQGYEYMYVASTTKWYRIR